MRLLISLLFLSSFAMADGYLPNRIQGKVVDIFIGELDPYVGDFCVITLRDENSGQLYGLVSEEGPSGPLCDDAELLQEGWRVRAYRGGLQFMQDSVLIGALHSYGKFIARGERLFFLSYDENLRFLGNSSR